MLHSAVVWDVLGTAGALPPWWPPVSYVLLAAGIAAACVSVLLIMLTRSRTPVTRRQQAGQMLAMGILIVGWLLRGHAEIPPDMPIVAVEVVAAALFAFFTLRPQQR